MKITFAAGQKHPVFTIGSCRSEIKTSDLWDYCVTERGTTGTNVPEHSQRLSKSADLHLWIISPKNMRISSTCEGDLNDQLWIEKCFVFLLGFGGIVTRSTFINMVSAAGSLHSWIFNKHVNQLLLPFALLCWQLLRIKFEQPLISYLADLSSFYGQIIR